MKILHTLRLDRMKWRHWVLLLLLILVTLTKMIPFWGVIYTYRVYPVIGSLLSPISGIFPATIGMHTITRRLSEEKGGFRKGDRISAVGIRMVLCCLGTELFAARYLLQSRHAAS